MVAIAIVLFVVQFGSGGLEAQKKGRDWEPVTPEDLGLADNPAQPGAPAMILYREMFTDDVNAYEMHYYRIKIFNEEGRKWGDVEISYPRGDISVGDIQARTIRPDGSIVEFNGKVLEKMVVKRRGGEIRAKAFSLPEVSVGSIIEYRYKLKWDSNYLFPTRWHIDHELYTQRAEFTVRPYLASEYGLQWVSFLPKNVPPLETGKGKDIYLEVRDIPPFQKEEHMPPEAMARGRVEFYYTRTLAETPEKFWVKQSEEAYEYEKSFGGKEKAMAQAVAQIVSPGDSPETKLRKIYQRVQAIRNLTWEREKTEKEEKRENLKDNNHVEDVWKRGYGYSWQIDRLFVALARAAGLSADMMLICERDQYFFYPKLLDDRQLNGRIVVVQLGGQRLFLSPGTPRAPFGLLPWEKAGVPGFIPQPKRADFFKTPDPVSSDARIVRKATLTLEANGTLEGELEVLFTGQAALEKRLDELDSTEADRRKSLEEELKKWLPSSATLELTAVENWEAGEEPLRARATLRIPDMAVPTGRRLLLVQGIFQGEQAHPFRHAKRAHPIYFEYPYEIEDTITIELGDGLKVESLPAAAKRDSPFAWFEFSSRPRESRIELTRLLKFQKFYFGVEFYPPLRTFFDAVKTADEQQLVVALEKE